MPDQGQYKTPRADAGATPAENYLVTGVCCLGLALLIHPAFAVGGVLVGAAAARCGRVGGGVALAAANVAVGGVAVVLGSLLTLAM